MKKWMIVGWLSLFAGTLCAQEAASVKEEGYRALKQKRYASAFTKLDEYLKSVDNKDNITVFNTAYCADLSANYVAAENYFDLSIQNQYKTASAYMGKAKAQQAQGKVTEMLKTLETGIKACPSEKAGMEKMYAIHFLREGERLQQSDSILKAEKSFQKLTQMADTTYRVRGYLSLVTLYHDHGNTILEASGKLADKNASDREKRRALVAFNKAKEYLRQASKLRPDNEEVKACNEKLETAITPDRV